MTTMLPTFETFFAAAFPDTRRPYGYQQSLADEPCVSRLICAPTSVGKIAAVVLSRLWNRAPEHRRLPKAIPSKMPSGDQW